MPARFEYLPVIRAARDAEQTEFAHAFDVFPRKLLGFVVLPGDGCNLLLCKCANRLAHRVGVFAEVERFEHVVVAEIVCRKLHGAHEMSASELTANELAHALPCNVSSSVRTLDHITICAYQGYDRVVGHVEHEVIPANAFAPQPRDVFRCLHGARVQEAVSTRRVCCNRKGVPCRISELHNGMFLHAQITTRDGLTIECR